MGSRDEADLEAHCCCHLAACTELSGKASRPFSGARMAAESTELSADKQDDCMVEVGMAVTSSFGAGNVHLSSVFFHQRACAGRAWTALCKHMLAEASERARSVREHVQAR